MKKKKTIRLVGVLVLSAYRNVTMTVDQTAGDLIRNINFINTV
jgi:hypothetical protein